MLRRQGQIRRRRRRRKRGEGTELGIGVDGGEKRVVEVNGRVARLRHGGGLQGQEGYI